MKTTLATITASFGLLLATQAAEVSAKLEHVHMCCGACVKGVATILTDTKDVKGVTATADQKDKTIALTGPDAASIQKVVDALVHGGYFGTTTSKDIKVVAETGAKGEKVKSLQVAGVHLCCDNCVKAVDAVIKEVAGAKEHTAKKSAKTFEVTGDFSDKDLFTALNKAGLTGKIEKH